MKLIIRSVSTWTCSNIRVWEPVDSECVALTIDLEIGCENRKNGTERFSIGIATPKGLSTLAVEDGIIAQRAALVMNKYDYDDLWNWLVKTVKSCEADTWNESVGLLRLYFDWEYDD